jgi:GTPase
MSDNLIERLQYLGRVAKDYDQDHMTSADYEMIPAVTKQAETRIEELERELVVAIEVVAESGRKRGEAEAKLAKAMVALQAIADDPYADIKEVQENARATLDELEVGE